MKKHHLKVLDTHAGGDVSRIVYDGVGDIPGDSVRAKMEYLQHNADGLRRLLLTEPYGIPEMSVDLLVPASHPDAVANEMDPPTLCQDWFSTINQVRHPSRGST